MSANSTTTFLPGKVFLMIFPAMTAFESLKGDLISLIARMITIYAYSTPAFLRSSMLK